MLFRQFLSSLPRASRFKVTPSLDPHLPRLRPSPPSRPIVHPQHHVSVVSPSFYPCARSSLPGFAFCSFLCTSLVNTILSRACWTSTSMTITSSSRMPVVSPDPAVIHNYIIVFLFYIHSCCSFLRHIFCAVQIIPGNNSSRHNSSLFSFHPSFSPVLISFPG